MVEKKCIKYLTTFDKHMTTDNIICGLLAFLSGLTLATFHIGALFFVPLFVFETYSRFLK